VETWLFRHSQICLSEIDGAGTAIGGSHRIAPQVGGQAVFSLQQTTIFELKSHNGRRARNETPSSD
jgi:hypothetical protein